MNTHVAQWKYCTERRGCPIKNLRMGYKILRGTGYFFNPSRGAGNLFDSYGRGIFHDTF